MLLPRSRDTVPGCKTQVVSLTRCRASGLDISAERRLGKGYIRGGEHGAAVALKLSCRTETVTADRLRGRNRLCRRCPGPSWRWSGRRLCRRVC